MFKRHTKSRADTPGRFAPFKTSMNAAWPLEICDTEEDRPSLFRADVGSIPPTMVKHPLCVMSANVLASSLDACRSSIWLLTETGPIHIAICQQKEENSITPLKTK